MYYLKKNDYLHTQYVFVNRVVLSESDNQYPHAHEFIEIAFIADGTGNHTIAGKEYAIGRGDIFVINYDTEHLLRARSDDTLTVYNVVFAPAFFDYALLDSRDFSDITRHFLLQSFLMGRLPTHWSVRLEDDDLQAATALCEKMHAEYSGRQFGYVQVIRACLIELLILIFRAIRSSGKLEVVRPGPGYEGFDKILHYIEENFRKRLRIEDLSMLAFVSPTTFSRQFKALVGCTFKEYVQKLRIESACKLMRGTDMKIIDIAASTGYHDIKHFNAVFKRILGLTPSQFRMSPPETDES